MNRYGGVDILISNAGWKGPIKTVLEDSVEDFDRVMATNVRGVWLSFRTVLPELAKRGGGSVVLMSSGAGLVGFPTLSAYVASRHAVNGLAKVFALESAPVGVRVNAVRPGFIDTGMLDSLITNFAPMAGTDVDGLTGVPMQRTPLKRKATSEEVAKMCLYLSSDDSSYVTGSCMLIDGGVLAGVL